MQLGQVNFAITKQLDHYNAVHCGAPEMKKVPSKFRPGKCILISGHDMTDLKSLLKKCEEAGVDVYTHGEMLPAFSYP